MPEVEPGMCPTWHLNARSAEEGWMASCKTMHSSVSILHPEPNVPGAPDSKKPQGRSRTSLNFPVTWGPGFFMGPCLLWARTSWGIPVWRWETPACATRVMGRCRNGGVSPCLR